MPYKTVLVHLDTTERCAKRVDMALQLAKTHGARLHGCFAQTDPAASMIDPLHRAGDRLKAAFDEVTGKVAAAAQAAGVEVDFSMSPLITASNIIHYFVRAARHADIAVIGQYDREAAKGVVPEDMAEQVVLNAGRPVLVVPYAGEFPTWNQHVMVAWNAGREAARAMSDALPLLASASKVSVMVVRGKGNSEADSPGYKDEDVQHFLAAHGIASDLRSAVATEIGVVDMLLNRVSDEAAGTLVMGAHGHYGFPHILRGGVTREMLRHMTVPVLLSH